MAITDTPGAYLQTYMERHGKQIIIMLFQDKLSYLMVMVDPNLYCKYVNYDVQGLVHLHIQHCTTLAVIIHILTVQIRIYHHH